ncbi:MAG: transporter substrate-binding domain-containing protein [Planctomycetaceae bacterium]
MDASMRRWLGAAVIAIAACRAVAATAEPATATAIDRSVSADSPSRPLRVGVAQIAAIVEWRGDHAEGPMVDVWNEIARRLGLQWEFVRIGTVAELLQAAQDGTVDVALGPLAITEERERTLDLTHPVFHSGMRIAVRQRNDVGLVNAARSMISWRLLELAGLVLALALVSGHLLWWFERGLNPKSFPPDYPRGVIEALWWITSTIITGGCDDKHVDGPHGRILAFAWMIGGIGLIAAFTSVLTATMTAEQVTGVIHGPRDLAGRLVGVQQAAVTAGSVQRRGGIPQQYPTLREAVEALSLGMVEAVVGEIETLTHVITQAGKDGLRVVGPTFDSFDFGMALPNGSPLREDLNTTLLRMREEGTIERIMESWLGKHD